MDWSDEANVTRLRQLWAEGHAIAEIGRRMGVSKNVIVGKAHRLKLPSRPSPIHRRAEGELPVERRRPVRRSRVRLAPLASLPPAAPRQPQAAPAPAPPPQAVAPEKLTGLCCWPIGDPGAPGFRFCDNACLRSKPYCVTHSVRAVLKRQPKLKLELLRAP